MMLAEARKELKQIQKKIEKQRNEENNILRPLRDREYELEQEIFFEENKKYVGKCFKFKNGYDGDRKWFMYFRIIGISKERREFIAILFQKKPNETEIRKCEYGDWIIKESKEISRKEYDKQHNIILKEMEENRE